MQHKKAIEAMEKSSIDFSLIPMTINIQLNIRHL